MPSYRGWSTLRLVPTGTLTAHMWFLRELGGERDTGKLNSNQGHHLPAPGESFSLGGRMRGSHSCRDRQRARWRVGGTYTSR